MSDTDEDKRPIRHERKQPGPFRIFLAGLMGRCGLAVAGLAAEYAMTSADEEGHDAYLTDRSKLPDPAQYASKYDDLLLLQWARSNRLVSWGGATGRALAKGGSLGLLRWAYDCGCRLDWEVYLGAAEEGHLDIVRWAHAQGVPWYAPHLTWEMVRGVVCSPSPRFMAVYAAAKGRHTQLFRWMLANGAPYCEQVCPAAAAEGDQALLQWAREEGAPWDTLTCQMAGRGGHFGVFRWIHERGCPLVVDMMRGESCYNNFVNLTMFGVQRLVAEAVRSRTGSAKKAKACMYQFDSAYDEAWPGRLRVAIRHGASFEPNDVAFIRARFAVGVPGTPEEWDAYEAWLRAKCAGLPAPLYDGVR